MGNNSSMKSPRGPRESAEKRNLAVFGVLGVYAGLDRVRTERTRGTYTTTFWRAYRLKVVCDAYVTHARSVVVWRARLL